MLACTAIVWSAQGQTVEPIGSLYERERVSLNGEWAYIVEPLGQAVRSRNIRRDFPADEKHVVGGPLIEYDWDTSPTMTIPGDWNHQDPALWLYEGVVWHRKRFTAEVPEGTRALLYFEGAYYFSHVFLNDAKLGYHEGGFTPFAFDVTEHLKADGENSLVVAVDNSRRPDAIPSMRFDWWNYGGITRPAWLVLVPETHIFDHTITYNGTTITAEVDVRGPEQANQPVTIAIPELNLEATVSTGATGIATATFTPDTLTPWSPETPKRYAVRIATPTDAMGDQIGFRTIEVQGTDIVLNGQSVFLRGICLHEEAFDAQGRRASSKADLLALLESAKGLNANFVRLAHYPHAEWMTRMADSLGLMVWSEIPVYWEDIQYQNPKTLALARDMIAANYERDKNRASIIVWSVANETPIDEHRMTFLKTLIHDVRALDPTRLVSAALKSTSIAAADADGAGGAAEGITDRRIQRVDDPLGAYLDILAVNTYVGWYGSSYPDAIQNVVWETPYEKPMIFSEFGAGALRGERGDKMQMWTEEFQAYLIDETMKVATNTPFVRGTAPWVLKDFRSPRRWHGHYQQYWNRKGLVNEVGEKKLAYDLMLDWYQRLEADWANSTSSP